MCLKRLRSNDMNAYPINCLLMNYSSYDSKYNPNNLNSFKDSE